MIAPDAPGGPAVPTERVESRSWALRCLRASPRRTVQLLLRLLIWGVSLVGAVAIGFAAYAVLVLPRLEPWHTLRLKEEFTARRHAGLDFAGILSLEKRLFDGLSRKGAALVPAEGDGRLSRFAPDGWIARLTGGGQVLTSNTAYSAPYNRSFELAPEQVRGAALLVHGLTDSPYSMLALAKLLQGRGFHVVVLRLPGHGTVPAGMIGMTLEDWRAAVHIAACRAASMAGPDQPFYVVGYSTGGTLVLTYALESLENETLRRPTRVLLLSPAIELPRIAALTRVLDALAFVPGLERARWQTVQPEYDPYKYNSFAVNATRQVLRATVALEEAMKRTEADGKLKELPFVTTWQSVVDSTVGARGVFDRVFGHLSGGAHELVLFDVNRLEALEPLRTAYVNGLPEFLATRELPYTLTVISNRDPATTKVVIRRRAPGQPMTESPTDLAWPAGVVSVGHVALCFPPDDPVYGFEPGSGAHGVPSLGSLTLRGEAGALAVPLAAFTRLRSNPFFALIARQVDAMVDQDAPR